MKQLGWKDSLSDLKLSSNPGPQRRFKLRADLNLA
jgi:hypothetical protein